jgi:transcriptional antiterminator NusG
MMIDTPSIPDAVEPGHSPAEAPSAVADAPPEQPPREPPVAESASPEPDPSAEVPSEEKPKNPNMHWYVVKVQSGREDSIKEALERRAKIEGLEDFFGQVVVPVERYTEVRNGKRVTKKRKKFPGYVMAEVEYNDKILYLFRETSGVGDFVGASMHRAPTPMSDREVQSMLRDSDEAVTPKGGEIKPVAPAKIPFSVGDRVKVRDGTFQNMEGEIKEIKEPKDASDTYRIKVELTVWGRPVPVELDYWQIDSV